MKKLFLSLVLLLGFMFLVTGCGTKNVEGTLEEIMTKIYADIPEDQRPMGLTNTEVNEETVETFLGIGSKDIKFKEALASESMVGAIAHSVVLVRTEDGADVEKVKEQISKTVDPRKWVCVGVEKEDVIIKNKGNLIIVVIVENEETRTKLEAGFDSL